MPSIFFDRECRHLDYFPRAEVANDVAIDDLNRYVNLAHEIVETEGDTRPEIETEPDLDQGSVSRGGEIGLSRP